MEKKKKELHLLCPFICCFAFGLIPCRGYREYCGKEHRGSGGAGLVAVLIHFELWFSQGA